MQIKLPLHVLTALLLLALSLQAPSVSLAETIKFGAILPLSGEMALHGTEVRRGIELALEDAVANNPEHDYAIFFEDNEGSTIKSAAAAQKLISQTQVDAIITLWPPAAQVVAPYTEQAETLHYTIAWDPDISRRNKFILNHQCMVDQVARITLRHLQLSGVKRVAFFHLEESGFDLGAEWISKLAAEECIELVVNESMPQNTTDFRALVARAKALKPEAYLLWSVMPSMDLMIKQIKQVDPNAKITGYLDFAQDLSPLEGAEYVSEIYSSHAFTQRYAQVFGNEPQSKSPNSYDIVTSLIQAYESSPKKKLTAAAVKQYLTSSRGEIRGAVGKFEVSPDGNSSYPPVLRSIHSGKRQHVAKDLSTSTCSAAPS